MFCGRYVGKTFFFVLFFFIFSFIFKGMWHLDGMINRVQFSQLYIHNIKYVKKTDLGKVKVHALRKVSALCFDGLIEKSLIIQKLIKTLF